MVRRSDFRPLLPVELIAQRKGSAKSAVREPSLASRRSHGRARRACIGFFHMAFAKRGLMETIVCASCAVDDGDAYVIGLDVNAMYGGVEFPSTSGSSRFIEARYRRIETSEPTEFIPLQAGQPIA
jgi:hypothetical protein